MRNAIFAIVSWGPALLYIFIIDPDIDVKSFTGETCGWLKGLWGSKWPRQVIREIWIAPWDVRTLRWVNPAAARGCHVTAVIANACDIVACPTLWQQPRPRPAVEMPNSATRPSLFSSSCPFPPQQNLVWSCSMSGICGSREGKWWKMMV